MHRRIAIRPALGLIAGAALLGTLACASPWSGTDYFEHQARVDEADGHVAGEALAQRVEQMQRAHRDMLHYHVTLRTLRRHRSLSDVASFEAYLEPYMEQHLDPLLSEKERAWHPELQLLDANLLFAKAALLIEMRQRSALRDVIREIEGRYRGMEGMLVEYPFGTQSTLVSGLRELERRRMEL